MILTHEQYVRRVADFVISTAQADDQKKLNASKILYGAGQIGVRGVTYYDRWQTQDGDHIDLIEICALSESSPVQIAGTVIHELAHVLSGYKAGHNKDWKAACDRLGLRLAKAAGMHYLTANLRPDIRAFITDILPSDGRPNGIDIGTGLPLNPISGQTVKPKPCPMGIGTRGGTSRGKGSGSRLRKWICECGVIVRVASNDFQAHCDRCETAFKQDN